MVFTLQIKKSNETIIIINNAVSVQNATTFIKKTIRDS